jgi:hypothetical protein
MIKADVLKSKRDLKLLLLRNYKIVSISLTNREISIILGKNIEKNVLFSMT